MNLIPPKLFNLLTIILATCSLIAIPLPSQAAGKGKAKAEQVIKEKVILMPMDIPAENRNMFSEIQDTVVQGLKQKYQVYSGEQVLTELKKAADKQNHSKSTHCDETKCLQDVAMAFGNAYVAMVHVTKMDGGYALSISIVDVMTNETIYSNPLTCEGCNPFQLLGKLKELVGNSNNAEASEAALATERKAKAEELKQEQLAFEGKLRNADAVERKRLLDAKAEDDKHIAELKVQAEARRKSSGSQAPSDFPTIQSATAEIGRLKERIAGIEKGYDKELALTRKKVGDRYALRLAAVAKTQRDEFESTEEFNSKLDKKRSELNQQRDEELGRMNTETLAAADIAPLREKIKTISEREYTLSNESLLVNLGGYNADGHQFPVSINSKVPSVRFEKKGTVPSPISEAKIFKQQWVAGLIRAEAKMNPAGQITLIELVNDADNNRLTYCEGRFLNITACEDVQLDLADKYYWGLNGFSIDYPKVLEIVRPLATQGNPRAQSRLGTLYMFGLGAEQDYEKGLELIHKSTNQNNAYGQNSLAAMYLNGLGVAKDYVAALAWFRRASDQGLAVAQKNLGMMYQNGLGVAKDYEAALAWYRKAADQGDANGQNELGIMYQNGVGVSKDEEAALAWFRKAANQGLADAQYNLGRMYQNGFGVSKNNETALAWYRKAVDQGNSNGQYGLGVTYQNGLGVSKNEAAALAWFRKSADQGNPNGQFGLGFMYQNGFGVSQDYETAVAWYRKSADQNNSSGQNALGIMYLWGFGVPKDYGAALAWFRKAADQGNEDAKKNLKAQGQ
jgi:TPR repeat protein